MICVLEIKSVIFATRASIVCIDSGTRDTIRVLFALAIRFFDISINRYTPIIEAHWHHVTSVNWEIISSANGLMCQAHAITYKPMLACQSDSKESSVKSI